MGSLTKLDLSHLPTPLPLSVDYRLGRLSNRLTTVGMGHEIMAADAPTAEERSVLEIRRTAISGWMRPCDGAHLLKQIAALVGSRPGLFGDKEDQKSAIRIFNETLKTLPRFALDKAFADAHTGRLGQPPWVPTAADLHVAATRHLAAQAREKARIDAVLNARVVDRAVDPAKRGEVAEMARRAAAEISLGGVLAERQRMETAFREAEAKSEAAREAARQQAAAVDAMVASGGTDPRPMPKLSEEARRKFGPVYRTFDQAAE